MNLLFISIGLCDPHATQYKHDAQNDIIWCCIAELEVSLYAIDKS